jgi:hypothetical protein
VKQPAPGKYGQYVKHSTVNERLLAIVGPFTWEIVREIWGPTPEVKAKKTNKIYPARDRAIIGCIGRLTITIDDKTVSVEEAGDVEQAAMNEDGRNLKDASSDAFKRCAMRLGLGLHLWSQDDYFLHNYLKGQSDE